MTRDNDKTRAQLLNELEASESKRKIAEDALQESERLLADLYNSIQDGISVLDRNLEVRSVNRVMNEWYMGNLPLEGKKCYEVYHNADKACDPCPSLRCFTSGKTEQEIVPGLPGSEVEWVELYSFPIRDKDTGKVTGAVEFVRNITERKRAELALKEANDRLEKRVEERTAELLNVNENLKQEINERKRTEVERRKLEEKLLQARKMESIGTLAGGIAHDFNNILGAIIGFAELVSEDIADDSIAGHNIKQVLIASKRARELIKQILAFSRKTEKERKPVLLSQVVAEAIQLLRSTLPSTIEIRSHAADNLAPVQANITEIHQVIMNLCTNAAHAMNEHGGVLEIGLKEIDMDAETLAAKYLEPGRYQRLSVSDTGTGIAPETLDRIFEPYFTTKEQGEGSGMGLAVVHGIVKSCEGDITVYSEPGEGTVFHVYLPVAVGKNAACVHRPETVKGGWERILYVDDEKSLADMGTQVLVKLGYRVETKTDSMKALEVFRKDPGFFDLVITDQTMPQMTGVELCGELKNTRPDIPVILFTGFSGRIDETNYKSLGIDGFLMKPFARNEIAQVIREVLDSVK